MIVFRNELLSVMKSGYFWVILTEKISGFSEMNNSANRLARILSVWWNINGMLYFEFVQDDQIVEDIFTLSNYIEFMKFYAFATHLWSTEKEYYSNMIIPQLKLKLGRWRDSLFYHCAPSDYGLFLVNRVLPSWEAIWDIWGQNCVHRVFRL